MSTTAIIHARGTLAARPAAGSPGHIYFVTDGTPGLYRDNGSSWDSIEGAGGMTNPMTTAGDIITGGTAGAAQRLGGGTASQVLTMVSGAPAWATPAAGGALTQAYVGTNSVGASSETGTDFRQILQKVTFANACLVTDIEVYLKQNVAAQAGDIDVFIYDDVAGKPVHLLAWGSGNQSKSFQLYRVAATAGDARWFGRPLGYWVTATSYWIGFQWSSQGAQYLQYYAASGSDYYWDKGGNGFITDAPDTTGTVYTLTNSTKTYSIRANTIR